MKPSREEVLKVAGKPVAWRFKSPLGFQKVQTNNPIFSKNEKPVGWSALYTEAQLLTMYEAGAAAERSLPGKNSRAMLPLLEDLAAERAVSDKLLKALTVIVENGGIGPEDMFDDARAAIAEVEAMRKENKE